MSNQVLRMLELDQRPELATVIDALIDLRESHGRHPHVYVDGFGKQTVFEDVRVVNREGELEVYLVVTPLGTHEQTDHERLVELERENRRLKSELEKVREQRDGLW